MKNFGVLRMSTSKKLPYPLDFVIGQTALILGQAVPHYRTRRGITRIRDRVMQRKRLTLVQIDGEVFTFSAGDLKVSLRVLVHTDMTTILFPETLAFNRITLLLSGTPDECIVGCGEQFSTLNLKGLTVPIWVSEHHALGKLVGKFVRERIRGVNPSHRRPYAAHHTYYAQPTYLSSKGYALHADVDSYAAFTFHPTETHLHFHSVPKSVTVFHAKNPQYLVAALSDYLGRQPPLPEWVHEGAILAVQGGMDAVMEKLAVTKLHDSPVSAVWTQDWSGALHTRFGAQVLWHWRVDETLYPKLDQQIATLKELGVRLLGYVNPYLRKGTPLCDEAVQRGFLVRKRSGKPYWFVSTTFKAGMIDLTHPQAYQWFKTHIQTEMIDVGFSGWMADFGEYLPPDAVVYAGQGALWHNRWPVIWAKLNREAIDERGLRDTVFFFSRAGYTGITAYTNSLWTGDQHVDFSEDDGLPSALRAMLSMAASGVGVSHSDIGGYTTIFHMRRSPELFIRWAEMAVFTPLFRTHEGNRPPVNAQFDHPDVLPHFARLSRLHKALKPYLRHGLNQYQKTGIPVIRPMFFAIQDPQSWLVDTQFMVGDDMVVAPILKPGETQRDCVLPEGRWWRLFTGHSHDLGTHVIEVALGETACFIREGSDFEPLFKRLSES